MRAEWLGYVRLSFVISDRIIESWQGLGFVGAGRVCVDILIAYRNTVDICKNKT